MNDHVQVIRTKLIRFADNALAALLVPIHIFNAFNALLLPFLIYCGCSLQLPPRLDLNNDYTPPCGLDEKSGHCCTVNYFQAPQRGFTVKQRDIQYAINVDNAAPGENGVGVMIM
jgi:hypothetical protein